MLHTKSQPGGIDRHLARAFPDLTESDRTHVLQMLQTRDLEANEILFQQGVPGNYMAILQDGGLRVEASRPDGTFEEVALVGVGDFVGEMACIDPAPRSARVTADLPSTVMYLTYDALSDLREKAPSAFGGVISGITERVTARIRETNRRIEGLMGTTLPERDVEAAELQVHMEPASDKINLRETSALRRFPVPQLKMLLQISPPKSCPEGTYLCREGTKGSACFILLSGKVEVLKTVLGEERLLAVLGAGCMVGQMALVDYEPRSASVRARSDLFLIEITRKMYVRLLRDQNPAALNFQEQFAKYGVRQLRAATAKLLDVIERAGEVKLVLPHDVFVQGTDEGAEAEDDDDGLTLRTGDVHTWEGSKDAPADPAPGALAKMGPIRKPLGEESAKPRSDAEAFKMTMAYCQAALNEWGMSMQELDKVRHVPLGGSPRRS